MKNKGDQFRLIEEKHENFIAAVKKRDKVAATKVKMSGSVKKKKKKKREQEHIQHFLHKTCN